MIGFHPRLNTAVLLTVILAALPLISSCDMIQGDPTEQTIPTDSDQWQQKLGDTFEQLPEADRQVLSRYMLRMKLSEAYESGAMPRTTIKQALVQQREYERLHPNNPTGEKSPVVSNQPNSLSAQTYPVALLPVKTSDTDSLNQVKLQFMLSNHGDSPIQSFEGTLLMKDKNLATGKAFDVPLIEFDPAIRPEQSGKVVIDSSIEDINVMRAIRNRQDMRIEISEGTINLENGETIEFTTPLID